VLNHFHDKKFSEPINKPERTMKTLLKPSLFLLLTTLLVAADKPVTPPPNDTSAIVFRELRYDAKVSDDEARFVVELTAESAAKAEAGTVLFDGELALLPTKLPDGLRVEREGNVYRLFIPKPGKYQFKLDVVAKINRAEPWNQVTFKGPLAAIASITALAAGTDVDLQLLSGTVIESAQTNGVSRVRGFLGAEQTLALRWQSRATEVARKAVVAAESTVTAQITPTVIKYSTLFRYEVIQGKLSKLAVALPASHALTRLIGEQIRDWSVVTEGDQQVLTVEFIKPVEKTYQLTVLSEQTVETTPATVSLTPPQPLDAERESGSLNVAAEDMQVEIDSASGLRQVNAAAGSLAAYRFSGRPLALALKLKRIEPVVTATDRATARLEETRLLASHTLTLNVEKAGIYHVELQPQADFVVAEVRGEGVEDWKIADGKLRVSFTNRVLGARKLEVQLEQPLKKFRDQFVIEPLRVTGATKESAHVGAASAPGLRLKTAALVGLREIPVNRLPSRTDELLAYAADAADWKLSLSAERLAARVVAEIFNLVTIGDGLVGGSATIRYGLINQGVQEFRVQVPAHWKNVEFTGPNIRRKEQNADGTNVVVWTIGLQDKAWGGYTLVVTYDYQFHPQGATLPVAGVHALDVERETGSVAITTAASLKLNEKNVADPMRRVDEAELAAADRSFISRSVLLAYQYTGGSYDLSVDVKRYGESSVLSAVADRTQLTSVLTEAGELLTQASFMVKNNDKQFQRFLLPTTNFWSCYVNGQPVKPERDNDWLLVPLPRGANRDEAFAVDIVYAEKKFALKSKWSQTLQLAAPRTDVPNTYAEWQLYVPASQRLAGFGGSMSVPQGTTYDALDAWKQFLVFYRDVLREIGPGFFIFAFLALLVVMLVVSAVQRGWNGVLTLLVVIGIGGILSAMMLPALSKAKSRAQRINTVNNLKQIALSAKQFALDNDDRLPVSFEEMMAELSTDKVTYDVATGQRLTWIGAGFKSEEITPDSIIAYSPIVNGQCSVAMADGSVQGISATRFAEYAQRGLIRRVAGEELARRNQTNAVMIHQFATDPVSASLPATAAPQKPGGPRAIRIEIPRTGNAFLFTKVLNVRDEPLRISAGIMSLAAFQQRQMALQVAAFVAGLIVWWWQWRGRRNSFVLTLALALMLGSVSSLLIAWRALHDALIVGLPVVLVAVVAWLIWKFWPRRAHSEPAPEFSDATGIPPAIATILIAGVLSFASSAHAGKIAPVGPPPSASANVSILSASYTGAVNDRVAQLEATILVSAALAGQKIALFGEDVAVQSFTAKPGGAKIARDGKTVSVVLPRKGETTLQLKLLVRLGGDVAKRQLAFVIPAALTSKLALTIDQPEADVEFPGAISFKRVTEAQHTRLDALIGAGERVELSWTPRVKRAAEVAATVMCQNSTLVSFGGGVMSARSVLDYQVTQGELRSARVRLPAGHRLLRVEGESIRTWSTKEENGETVLVVELLKGVTPNYRLTVETEKSLDALPATAKVEMPHALEVKRETGLLALHAEDELELTVGRVDELQRVDPAAFTATSAGQGATGIASAFRFLTTGFALETRVAALQPQIEAVVRNNIRVNTDGESVSATVDYNIKRAGVFTLKLALPPGYHLDQVRGTNVQQWTERTEDGRRVLDVTLKERISGSYTLNVELSKIFGGLPKPLPIVGVHPSDTAKLTGFISVAANPGVAVKTESFDGLTEIPAATLPDYGTLSGLASVLAFKNISPEPKAAPDWKLFVTTEAVESWVRAEIVNTLTLTETLVSGRALVRYDIANAPVAELRLKTPASFKNVEISGANIRRLDQKGDEWRVVLQSKERGFYTLTVTWEQPRPAGQTNLLALTGVSAEGVERETGTLAIVARAPLHVTEARATDLLKLDTGEWPEWAGQPEANVALAYRYLRPGYQLAVEAKRFAEAEVLQALAETFNLTTVVAEDGQMMTELSVAVHNNGRQHLEIALPAGATVWSAFVAGQAVKPSLREGKLLLPLENAGSDDAALTVELTYVATNQFPANHGKVNLISPTLDVPLKNARWEVYLPANYRYDEFTGTMSRETGAAAEASSFSFLEYSQKEWAAKAEQKKGLKSEISSAKKKLAEGNVKEAANYYSRYNARGGRGDSKDAETKQVEAELRRVQGSNLVQAQQAFTVANNGAVAPNQPAQQLRADDRNVNYDATAAEQQWEKLQQAQEIAVAKVRPLRVNLPTRGLRHAFAQVLQTETGKAMTVSFTAANTKSVSWPKRIGGGVAGFVALWVLVALVGGRAGRKEGKT
jgi:type II secretory pathway pseudopilin PulG